MGAKAPTFARRNCQASDLSNASDLRRAKGSGLRAKAQPHLSESELQLTELKPGIDELKPGIRKLKLQTLKLKPSFILRAEAFEPRAKAQDRRAKAQHAERKMIAFTKPRKIDSRLHQTAQNPVKPGSSVLPTDVARSIAPVERK